MKSKFFTVILLLLLYKLEIYNVNAQSMNEISDYKINIINYYMGRIDHRTIITTDSISYENSVHRGNSKIHKRKLTDSEQKELKSFLNSFPVNNLEKGYVNNNVKDGTQMKFIIKINNYEKEIFVANVYQENLGELVSLIVKMLPNDFIQYNKQNIYPY